MRFWECVSVRKFSILSIWSNISSACSTEGRVLFLFLINVASSLSSFSFSIKLISEIISFHLKSKHYWLRRVCHPLLRNQQNFVVAESPLRLMNYLPVQWHSTHQMQLSKNSLLLHYYIWFNFIPCCTNVMNGVQNINFCWYFTCLLSNVWLICYSILVLSL